MINQLKGLIKLKTEKFVVLDVGGVGYRIFTPFETFRKLPKKGEETCLWTHLYVRENALDLYGFLNYPELEFFELLIQISGIGPKSALGVLSVAPIDVLKKAISTGEISYLTKVSGIGQRLAEKIVLELKNKIGALAGFESGLKHEEEALDALRALGYSLKESRDALKNLPDDANSTENIIKEALKNVSKE